MILHTHKEVERFSVPLCTVFSDSLSFSSSLPTSLSLSPVKEVDNTLTVIIVSVVGGVIGLVIIVMVIKALVVHFLLKDDEKK